MEIAELLKTLQKNIHLRIAGNKKEGVITNLYDFDSILSDGLHRGILNVVAGRHIMGKSSFAVTTACNIAEIHNLPIFFLN